MIQDSLKSSLKEAMIAKNTDTVRTLRMVIASLQNEKIAKQSDLNDSDVVAILKREVKKRDEALEAYEAAGRTEQANVELIEKEIIQQFLPTQLSEEEITKVVEDVVASEPQGTQFGPLMQKVMERLKGKADGGTVSKILKQKIT